MKPKIIIIGILILLAWVLQVGFFYIWVNYLSPFSPEYYKREFKREIKKDDRFEELLYFFDASPATDHVYDIGIALKDGRKIGGEVRPSIYRFRKLTMIDDYEIYTLSTYYNEYTSKWRTVHSRGITTALLKELLNKPSDYLDTDLNGFIDCYDEIKELVEKIYNEGPIPGKDEDIENDIDQWGDEEKLKEYTGYYADDISRKKIYIKYNGNNDDY